MKLVVASAGTYHLPFERLSEWMGRWLAGREDVRLVMQHGPSRPVPGAENVEILPYDELLNLCRQASAVVLQGGAGGIMDMRALGIVPIVVPRVPGDGEVVDDHQLVFSAEMADAGLLARVLTYDDLARALDAALAAETAGVTRARPEPTPGAAEVRRVLEHPIRVLPWPHVLRRGVASAVAIVRSMLRRSAR